LDTGASLGIQLAKYEPSASRSEMVKIKNDRIELPKKVSPSICSRATGTPKGSRLPKVEEY